MDKAEKVVKMPKGTMPVYSEEAHPLLVVACPTNYDGEFFARELTDEQAFSDRLRQTHELMISNNARQSSRRSPQTRSPASGKRSRSK